jgi:NADPH:quinone reductase-like Zn-dependent oxidoreductase
MNPALPLNVFTVSRTVITTTSTQEKNTWLLSLPNGATHAANYKTQDFAQVVNEATQGKGVNVIIDFVGRTHFQKNLDSLALDGRMTILALLSGKSADCGLLIR